MHFLSTFCTAFDGERRIASGPVSQVAVDAKRAVDRRGPEGPSSVLVFDDSTGEVIEFDWRGSVEAFSARLSSWGEGAAPLNADGKEASSETPRGPGRPRLGVVAREVTLLPRHWEWLGQQTGGASVALRRLVEAARKGSEAEDQARARQTAAYRFMVTIAGHQPGFEEASRSLFAGDHTALAERIRPWPEDVQSHLLKMLAGNPVAEKRDDA